ncbi:unnamed protein product [Plasmodium vivax]|uniref:(malaria parasite P. vivax) hypothetical protein n=1 Tax=Plasmodium vivax TaxID=5855 RepID=A0A8S4H513_PLAVI|nr:unnamed protein product [Plasmodium vivax]
MNIEEWKEKYPFLKNAWASYEDFEKSVGENDDPASSYGPTCKHIISTTISDTTKYHDFCIKLIRNLGGLSMDQKTNQSAERCKNIHSWLYYFVMKYNIPNNFIQKCFEESKPLDGIGDINDICPYNPHEKVINVADDMLKITIFVDNISSIIKILKDEKDEYNCLGKRFLYECFNIYNEINTNHCSNGGNNLNKKFCSKLDEFKSYYGIYISTLGEVPEEIKFLKEKVVKFTDDCSLTESKTKSMPGEAHRTGSSGPSSTTTALSTVAGVSSALALLYKFTPAGRWINFGLLGGRRGTNNDFHGEEGHEMLFDENIHSEPNSYNIGYEKA